MITVKYIPNILDKNNRVEKQLKYSRRKLLRAFLDETGFAYGDKRIIISGKVEEDLSKFIENGDEILIVPDITAPVFAVVALVLTTVAKLGFLTIALGIVAAVTAVAARKVTPPALANIVAQPRMPSFGISGGGSIRSGSGSSGGIDTSSPTYGWEGIRTVQEVGLTIPVVYGEHKVGGNIISAYIKSNGDKNYLNVLLALGQGEIESIDGIKANDNPIANFDGITTTKKYGTTGQSVIPNFNDSHNLYTVSVSLPQNNPHTYTTFDSDVEGFDILLQLPSGLFLQEVDSGKIKSWSITYKVEYKIHGNGGWVDLGSTTITEKSRSVIRRIYSKRGLAANKYDVKVTKTSADSDFRHYGDLSWSQIDEIKTDDYSYPNIALLSIEALASGQLSGGIPNFTCIEKGLKISIPDVKNTGVPVDWEDYYWDPVAEKYKLFSDDTVLTWDDVTYVTKYCANPIWCIKDLQVNDRYGLGEFIGESAINANLTLEQSRHCEEKVSDGNGGYEKRFRLDVVLDGPGKALDVITQLALICRGLIFYSAGKANIIIDKPGTPTQLFTMGNIIKDSFVQNWKSVKDIPNVLEVQILDKDNDYRQEVVSYIDRDSLIAGNPMRKAQIKLLTTRKSQAIREARYTLKAAKYITRTIGFKAGIDAIACQAGELISVSHDVPLWGYSGRVKTGSTTSKVMVDQDLVVSPDTNYRVMIQFKDNTMSAVKTVTNAPGEHNEITIDGTFAQTPSEYDKYVFGEVDKIKKDFRLVSMLRDDRDEIQIVAVEYNEDVYDDSEITIPENNYSLLDLSIMNVENLVLTERLVKMQDGTIEDAIDVWFDIPDWDAHNFVRRFSKVRIYLSENNIDWTLRGETLTRHYPIIGDLKDKTAYYVKVVTVTDDLAEGSLTNSPTGNITIEGKSAPPSDVSSFLINQNRDRLIFGWTEIEDVDVWGYEIRKGSTWDNGIKITFVQGNRYLTTELEEAADQHYWIKAIDTSNNYSTTPTEAVITIDNIPFRNLIKEYSEQTDWLGERADTYKDGNNLKVRDHPTWGELASETWGDLAALTWGTLGPGVLTGKYITLVKDLTYVCTVYVYIELVTAMSGGERFDTDPSSRFDDRPTLRFIGDETIGATGLEIKTSDNGADWTEWLAYQIGDYKCRYYQLRLTLTRDSLDDDLLCSKFDHFADLPDIDEYGDSAVADAGAGKGITFEKTFHEEPVVNINIVSGDGIYYKTSSKDTVGMTVKLYDAGGVAKTGDFEYHIHGI